MSCCTLDYGPRFNIGQYNGEKLFCFQENATMQVKKKRQKVDLAAIGRTIKDVGKVLYLGSIFGFHFSV